MSDPFHQRRQPSALNISLGADLDRRVLIDAVESYWTNEQAYNACLLLMIDGRASLLSPLIDGFQKYPAHPEM